MRLLQLARKLEIPPSELIIYLKKQGIKMDEQGLNVKLDDAICVKAQEHFKPEMKPSPTDTIPPDENIDLQEEEAALIAQPANVTATESIEDAVKAEEIDAEQEQKDEIEVIRAKTIKLQGIKVVGKIDLPEPPKKTKTQVDGEEATDTQNEVKKESVDPERKKSARRGKSEHVQPGQQRQQRPINTRRTELSYEEKLKRRERAEERKRKKLDKQKKEQKRQRYLKSIQQSSESKAKKKAQTLQGPALKTKPKPTYRNPLRRFWGWLNGEFDDF